MVEQLYFVKQRKNVMNAYNQQQLQHGESKQTKQMKVSLNTKAKERHANGAP